MYLIEQYALYVSDDRYEFDQYTGEPVFIGNVINEPPKTGKARVDGQEERWSDAQTDDDDEDSDSDDDEDDDDDDRDVYMTADEGAGEGEDEDDDEASDLALEEGELAEN